VAVTMAAAARARAVAARGATEGVVAAKEVAEKGSEQCW
jgi:hypothetical protein